MIISRTPLRISLAGGGTDIPPYAHEEGGVCVSLAITKYVYVSINERFESNFRVSYTQVETKSTIDGISHDLIRECLRYYKSKPVEVATMADIPGTGTGLGSSGAVLVGTICALDNDYSSSQSFFAELASAIEMDTLGKSGGYQDQFASAFGGFNCHYFTQNGSMTDPLPHGEHVINRLMLFYTGKTRQASKLLNVHKNAPKKYLDAQRILAVQMKEKIQRGFINDIGILMDEGWHLKRNLQGVTSHEIDSMYRTAKEAGAIGGKICGAGGGGFLCLFVPMEKQTAVRKALWNYKELTFGLDTEGAKVVYSD